MRIVTPFLVVTLLLGCAAEPSASPLSAASAPPASPSVTTSSATAKPLAFDPATSARPAPAAPPPDLSRDARGPSASNGTVQSSTSTYNVTTSVQDTTTHGDFTQSSVSQQAGTVRK